MVRLDDHSYVRVLETLHAVREVTEPDDFGQAVADALLSLVPCDVVSFNEVDPANGRLTFVISPPTFPIPPGSHEALVQFADQHPLINHMNATGDGSARKISDFWTSARWRASAIYQDFYRGIGVEYQISIAIPAPAPMIIGIALSSGARDFTERDRAVLNLVRPHIAQSWRHAREHRLLRELADTATGVLTARGTGVIVLGDPPQSATPSAFVTLYRFFGRPSLTDPMPTRVARWIERERAATRSGQIGELARPLTATLEGRRLVLRFLPAAGGHSDAILLAEDDGVASTPTMRAVGLTAREVEIMSLVATGARNAEIATKLHIAPSTVKKHLDNVYAKLGVSGRARASAVVLQMLAHHGD